MTRSVDYAERWQHTQGHESCRTVLRDAAHEMIRSNGLARFNMRALAKRVGLSPMAAYRYYDSKDVMIEDIRSDITLSFAVCLEEAAAHVKRPIDQFNAMCSAYVDFAISNSQDYLLMFGDKSSTLPVNNFQPIKTAWEVLLNVLKRINPNINEDDMQDQAHLIWSSLHGLVILHISGRLVIGRSISQILPKLNRMLVALTGAS